MNISQPKLSRNIAALESELGLILFERKNNIVRLTRNGDIIYRELFDSRQRLDAAVAQALRGSDSHSLKLGFVYSEVPTTTVTRAVSRLRAEHPQSDVAIRYLPVKTLLPCLKDHTLDAAVMLGESAANAYGLNCEHIESVPVMLAASAMYPPAGGRQKLINFRDELFISVKKEASERMTDFMRGACSEYSFEPNIVETANIDTQISWIESGKGVAILPGNHRGRRNPLLSFMEMGGISKLKVMLVWPASNTNALFSRLKDLLFTSEMIR